MNIVSKAVAMTYLVGDREIHKFDNGKYKWTGSARDYLGKEVQQCRGVHAVYAERRTDKNGPYAQLMCVSDKW